jgi:hypothetical protein
VTAPNTPHVCFPPKNAPITLRIAERQNYGRLHRYIVGEHADAISGLTGKKTVSPSDLRHLLTLGVADLICDHCDRTITIADISADSSDRSLCGHDAIRSGSAISGYRSPSWDKGVDEWNARHD